MTMLNAVSPGIKVLFERFGRPEIINRPDLIGTGGAGAIIACNHVGWADSLWLAYAVYPRPLRYLSKQELFRSPLSRWALHQAGSIPIDRTDPSPSSIKSVVDSLRNGEIILIFPSGTRTASTIAFKRGAATIALHAEVPLVPAFYRGPKSMLPAHMINRPRVQVSFGTPIPTLGLGGGKQAIATLTVQLQKAIDDLRASATSELSAA